MVKRIFVVLMLFLAFGGMQAHADGQGDLVELEGITGTGF